MASLPTGFQHGFPGFDRIVSQHPSPRLRDGWPGLPPAVGLHRNPLSMGRRRVRTKTNQQMLHIVDEPALAAQVVLVPTCVGRIGSHGSILIAVAGDGMNVTRLMGGEGQGIGHACADQCIEKICGTVRPMTLLKPLAET